jgi:hypothetical protein
MKAFGLSLLAGVIALSSTAQAGPLDNVIFGSITTAVAGTGSSSDSDDLQAFVPTFIQAEAGAIDGDSQAGAVGVALTSHSSTSGTDLLKLETDARFDIVTGGLEASGQANAFAGVTFDITTLSKSEISYDVGGTLGFLGSGGSSLILDKFDFNTNTYNTVLFFSGQNTGSFSQLLTAGSYRLTVESTANGFAAANVPVGFVYTGTAFSGVDMKVQAVPEPATFAVLGLGVLAMARRRKKS